MAASSKRQQQTNLDNNSSGKNRVSRLKSYHHTQQEMPIALVQDEPLSVMPRDLYIPPAALMVILEAFEGPLDLLLYLIRRQNLNVLDIPIAEITAQYMDYIAMMRELDLEIAAEYLLMASVLAEIKSRMLLPRAVSEDEEEDPRAELVRRLQEYERFKQAAENIDQLPRMERDTQLTSVALPEVEKVTIYPQVELQDLLIAFKDVLARADQFTAHSIRRETLSVREKMSNILDQLQEDEFTNFNSLLNPQEGRLGIVVTFLAILELLREAIIDLVQSQPFAPIYIKPASI